MPSGNALDRVAAGAQGGAGRDHLGHFALGSGPHDQAGLYAVHGIGSRMVVAGILFQPIASMISGGSLIPLNRSAS